MSEPNVEFIRRYFDAIEAGVSAEELSSFFSPDVIQEEFPNSLIPHGTRRDLNDILEASKRGRQVMRSQRYEIVHTISEGDEIALEVLWTGVLNFGIGSLQPGAAMTARFAVFIRLVAGKIARQRNYDCFDPF